MIEQLENLVRTGGLKAEYEGYLDVDEKLLEELLQATDVLLEKISE